MRFRRAREATAFTERGISYYFEKFKIIYFSWLRPDVNPARLFKPQQAFDKIQVGLRNFALLGHDALTLLRFLSKNVTFERFLEGDFARAGNFEPLFGT